MKIKGIALLLFVYLSSAPIFSKAQTIENADALNTIILYILNDESTIDTPSPVTRDSDFSDVSSWSITATSDRDIANALDNNPNTRWATRETQRPGEFFEINFNTVKTFNNIVLDSNASPDDYPRRYDISVSQDGSNWTRLETGIDNQSEIEIILPVQTAQYLRIEQNGSSSSQWWSIHELKISLDSQLPEPTEDLDSDFSDVLAWDINATSDRSIDAAFDNDPTTRWSTRRTQEAGLFFEINFNTQKTFNNIVLDSNESPDDSPREYEIFVSQDGSNWTSVFSDFSFQQGLIEIVLPVQTAQYLRIELTGPAQRSWWSIFELIISLDDQEPAPIVDHTPTVSSNSIVGANRFLNQATFGATEEDVQELISLNNNDQVAYERWIDEQLSVPASTNHLNAMLERYVPDETGVGNNIGAFVDQWFVNTLEAPDQLRQRVAWALSQIMVISLHGNNLHRRAFGVADYYDTLVQNSFGNYRDLIEDITLHPTMGQFLSMAGNGRADGITSPDENFARELMQLFSIGLVQLNLDGSPVLDGNGQPIDTFNTQVIEGFARAFTWWDYQCQQVETNCRFGRVRVGEDSSQPELFNQVDTMVLYPDSHEPGAKTVLSYPGAEFTTIPAGLGGEQDLKMALDNIFNHPNVGPFMAKQLIQRMVTSNPSPAYIERVARVFNDDGDGTRGNLAAVVKAILLDSDARTPVTSNNIRTASKMKEPIMRIIHLWRNYDIFVGNGNGGRIDVSENFNGGWFSPSDLLAQGPMQAPSVFNFYSPFYAPAGDISDEGLVAPELQLANEFLNTALTNYFYEQIDRNTSVDNIQDDRGEVYIDISEEIELSKGGDPDALINRIAVKLFGGEDQISTTVRDIVRDHLDQMPPTSEDNIEDRAKEAIFLIMTSPEFAWQK